MSETTNLENQEFYKKLLLAREYLECSKGILEKGAFRISTDVAYNAAELAMKIGILLKQNDIPKRHGAISQLFNLLYVKDGRLEKTMGRRISDGLEFRSSARYDENAEITQEHASHNIALAKELIEFLEKKLKQK